MFKIESDDRFSEHHLFKLFGRNILFNVETILSYEVTPLVHDLVTLLSISHKCVMVESAETLLNFPVVISIMEIEC